MEKCTTLTNKNGNIINEECQQSNNSEITGVAPTEITSPENTYEHDEPQINSPDSIIETNTTVTGMHEEQKPQECTYQKISPECM